MGDSEDKDSTEAEKTMASGATGSEGGGDNTPDDDSGTDKTSKSNDSAEALRKELERAHGRIGDLNKKLKDFETSAEQEKREAEEKALAEAGKYQELLEKRTQELEEERKRAAAREMELELRTKAAEKGMPELAEALLQFRNSDDSVEDVVTNMQAAFEKAVKRGVDQSLNTNRSPKDSDKNSGTSPMSKDPNSMGVSEKSEYIEKHGRDAYLRLVDHWAEKRNAQTAGNTH